MCKILAKNRLHIYYKTKKEMSRDLNIQKKKIYVQVYAHARMIVNKFDIVN